jgi:hypothetical protein
MSTTYTLAQLSTMMDNLTARVTAVDGQGLATGLQGTVAIAQAKANGVAADQVQLTAVLQQKLNTLITSVNTYITSVRSLLAVSSH